MTQAESQVEADQILVDTLTEQNNTITGSISVLGEVKDSILQPKLYKDIRTVYLEYDEDGNAEPAYEPVPMPVITGNDVLVRGLSREKMHEITNDLGKLLKKLHDTMEKGGF